MTGLVVVIATVLAATAFGVYWRSRQGRIRTAPGTGEQASAPGDGDGAALPDPVLRALDPAAAVTLLLLSAPVCARCPQARTVLRDLRETTAGLGHAELDLAEHPEVSGSLGVRSTPTILAVGRAGRELFRVTGVPRRAELLSAVQAHL